MKGKSVPIKQQASQGGRVAKQERQEQSLKDKSK